MGTKHLLPDRVKPSSVRVLFVLQYFDTVGWVF